MSDGLCELAVAPSIDEDLATVLLGSAAPRVLEEAIRLGFLSVGVDGFDLHPLLRQFLRNKHLDDRETGRVAARLTSFYLHKGKYDEAFLVAEEFGLNDRLIDVLQTAFDALLADGRLATLERWVAAMHSRGLTNPVIRLTEAELALREGRWGHAEEITSQLARSLTADDPLIARVLYRAGNAAQLNEKTAVALEFHREAQRHAQNPFDLRHALWGRFICAMELEKLDDAGAALDEFEAVPAEAPEDLLRSYQAHLLTAKRTGSGIDRAIGVARPGLALVPEATDPLVRTGFTHTFGSALVLAAQYEEALGLSAHQLREAKRLGVAFVVTHVLSTKAAAEFGLRLFGPASQTLDAALRDAREQRDVHAEMNATSIRMRLLLAQARVKDATVIARLQWRRTPGPGMYGEFLATGALVFACAGNAHAAEQDASASSITNQVEARVLRGFARALLSMDSADYDGLMEDALDTAEATENYDGFVSAYRASPRILTALANSPNRWTVLEDVVERLDPQLGHRLGLHAAPRQPGSTLSRRETEVLGLLRAGLSNREIARTLWISESTAKVHVRHILSKLGVRTRTQAAVWESSDDAKRTPREGRPHLDDAEKH
jgi:ATP/maltotriose-dependent transcriptional regulator MalT